MRIDSLILYSTASGSEIRNIKFNPEGLSLIVDETIKDKLQKEESGSSVGKTCLVKVIDLCLGAKDLNILYKNDQGGIYQALKDYVDKEKISAKLLLVDSYGNTIILERQLFEKGKQFINNKVYKGPKDYKNELKRLIFPNSGDISFRNLIPFFIRYNGDLGLKFLGQMSRNSEYQSYYSYLLQISQPQDISKLLDEKEALGKENKKLLHGFKSVEDFKKKLEEEEAEIAKLKIDATSYDNVAKEFKNEDANNMILRKELDDETDKYYSLKTEETILNEKIKKEQEDVFNDRIVLKAIFKETNEIFNGLSKSFDDLVNFHNSMCDLRIKNYVNQLHSIQSKIQSTSIRLDQLRSDFEKRFTDFKFKVNDEANSKFEVYYSKKLEVQNKNQDLQRFKDNTEKIDEIVKRLNKINSEKDQNEVQKTKIKDFFDKLALDFSTKETHLDYNFSSDKIPLSLTSKESTGGDGDQRCLTAALIFTIVKMLSEKYDTPLFIIQDGMEQVPLVSLKRIFDFARTSKYQYIVPILKDRIEDLKVSDSEIILKLSPSDKLFKFDNKKV